MYEHIFSETPEERAKRYRGLALAAEEYADHEVLPSIRAAYLRSAERWNKLAAIMELGAGQAHRKPEKAPACKPAKKARGWTIHKQQSGIKPSAPRYYSASDSSAGDGEQGTTDVASSGGIGLRRSVLGRRGVLGRPASHPLGRSRSA